VTPSTLLQLAALTALEQLSVGGCCKNDLQVAFSSKVSLKKAPTLLPSCHALHVPREQCAFDTQSLF
jgi:hypothetical protein